MAQLAHDCIPPSLSRDRMPLARTFLDWNRPALPAVAEFLAERYGGEGVLDLSGVVVVLTGRRACRRLVEILLEETDGRFLPPQTITEGEFPERLYEPQRPFAGRLVQHLAWAEAVRRMPRPQAEQVLREVPDDGDVDGWMALGDLLWRLHRELAAELLDFGDVLRAGELITGFNERRRWEALRVAQHEYLGLLDGLGLWDRQTARIVAVKEEECQTDCDVILVGTVDLNQSTRAMLDQVSDRVTALVHAPESLSDRFDEHGCLRPEKWMTVPAETVPAGSAPIPLLREQVRVVDKPLDQADEVVRVLAGFEGRYRADEITIGLADDGLVPQVERRLRQFGVPTRAAVGKSLPQTAVVRLLDAIASFLENERADHFATLVRHPDMTAWLDAALTPGGQGGQQQWLQELDQYLSGHLQQRLGFWLGSSEHCGQIQRVHELVSGLLADLSSAARPLAGWSAVMLDLLDRVLGERSYDPAVSVEKRELDAVGTLTGVLETHTEIPEPMMPTVTGAQALRLTIEELSAETVPPAPDADAIELSGWLDLPLDDAPALVVTSFNEAFVPSSVSADLFLPNRLRQRLGVTDNDRRYARDAYALCTLLASREEVVLVAGRRDDRGDPLLPSRLFFACDAAEAAERVKTFFAAETPPPLPLLSRTPDSVDVAGIEIPGLEGPGLVVPRPRPLAAPVTSVSVTAFRDYIQCPYRFYLRHVLKLESVPHETEEMDPRAFGNLVHDALRDFGRSDVRNSTSSDEIAEFLRATVDALSEQQYGRYRLPSVSVQVEQARRRLEAFARWQAERARAGWTIAFVETSAKGEPVSLETDDGRTILIHGRIDRIDQHADRNEWALLDYKTGDSAEDPDKVHRKQGEWVDLQLPLYLHLAARLGVEGSIALGYVTLPGETGEVRERMAPWSEDDLITADQKAREVARNILDERFWPPNSSPPQYPDGFEAICQDGVFERRLAE